VFARRSRCVVSRHCVDINRLFSELSSYTEARTLGRTAHLFLVLPAAFCHFQTLGASENSITVPIGLRSCVFDPDCQKVTSGISAAVKKWTVPHLSLTNSFYFESVYTHGYRMAIAVCRVNRVRFRVS